MADTDIGIIRVLYSNDAGSIRNTSPASNADVLRDNQYMGTTDDNGYLYFDINGTTLGVHTFSASVVIGNSYYYGSMMQNITSSTKGFTIILKKDM
jgi:hypothetical protein